MNSETNSNVNMHSNISDVIVQSQCYHSLYGGPFPDEEGDE